jgi:uncharacterized protein with GYD domain
MVMVVLGEFICPVLFSNYGDYFTYRTLVRSQAKASKAKDLGGELKQFYLCLGAYDIIVVYDMPDNAKAAAFALSIGTVGAVRTTTMAVFPEAEYKDIIDDVAA